MSSLLTSVIFGMAFYYFSHKKIHHHYKEATQSIHAELRSKFFIFDALISEEEKVLDRQMKIKLPLLAKDLAALNKDLKKVANADLLKLCAKYKTDQIYIIDKNGIIVNTTFKKDLNLNLKKVDLRMGSFLENIFKNHQVRTDRFTISVLTGKINKYSYYNPPGADYIVEISHNIKKYLKETKSQAYVDLMFDKLLTTSLKSIPHIKDIDIYIALGVRGWSIVNSGENLPTYVAEFVNSSSVRFEHKLSDNLLEVFEKINRPNAYYSETPYLITKVTYDESIHLEMLQSLVLYSLGMTVLVSLLIYFFTAKYLYNNFTAPLEQIISHIGGLSHRPFSFFPPLSNLSIPELKMINQTLISTQEKLLARENELSIELEEKEKNQKILFQQSKMAVMGNMISNITHQLKQPLNTIVMSKECLNEDVNDIVENLPDKEKVQKAVKVFSVVIDNQVRYMNQTINDFKNFFTPDKAVSQFYSSKAIRDVLNIVRERMKLANVKVEFVIVKEELIEGHFNEFKQAILNLFNNALDAFGENEIDTPEICIDIQTRDIFIEILITDNAGGIPGKLLPDLLFNEYNTTKGASGTGIGLYITKSIIEKSLNGKIVAYNKTDGACFKITVPLLDKNLCQ